MKMLSQAALYWAAAASTAGAPSPPITPPPVQGEYIHTAESLPTPWKMEEGKCDEWKAKSQRHRYRCARDYLHAYDCRGGRGHHPSEEASDAGALDIYLGAGHVLSDANKVHVSGKSAECWVECQWANGTSESRNFSLPQSYSNANETFDIPECAGAQSVRLRVVGSCGTCSFVGNRTWVQSAASARLAGAGLPRPESVFDCDTCACATMCCVFRSVI